MVNVDFKDDQHKCSTFLNQNVLCSIQDKHTIAMNWVLPDIQSTAEVFYNENLFTNIHDNKHDLIIKCSPGIATKKKKVTSRAMAGCGTIQIG